MFDPLPNLLASGSVDDEPEVLGEWVPCTFDFNTGDTFFAHGRMSLAPWSVGDVNWDYNTASESSAQNEDSDVVPCYFNQGIR